MENAQLTDYIAAERARGVTDPDIQQALLTSGWAAEMVTMAFTPVATSLPTQSAPAASPLLVSPAASAISPTQSLETAPLSQLSPQVQAETPTTTPKSLKVAAILVWLLAGNLTIMASLLSLVLFMIANIMHKGRMVVPELITSAVGQQPFMLVAIAVMLVWLGRGVSKGAKKLTIMALLVTVGAGVAWVATQWSLASVFARLTGENTSALQSFISAPTSAIQFVWSPVVLLSVAATIALILALPATDTEKKPPTLKAKIIMTILSLVILGPVLALSATVTAWSLDTDLGAKELATQITFPLHRLPVTSEFIMQTYWSVPKPLGMEPTPAAQTAVIPKADVVASMSAQRIIIMRQYPPSDIALAKILQLDPNTEAGVSKQVELAGGKKGLAIEKPFGQGKITTLAFVSNDGVIIRMTSVKALLPDLIKLANELN